MNASVAWNISPGGLFRRERHEIVCPCGVMYAGTDADKAVSVYEREVHKHPHWHPSVALDNHRGYLSFEAGETDFDEACVRVREMAQEIVDNGAVLTATYRWDDKLTPLEGLTLALRAFVGPERWLVVASPCTGCRPS